MKKAIENVSRTGNTSANTGSSSGAAGGFSTPYNAGPFSVGRGRGRGGASMQFVQEEPRLISARLTEQEARNLAFTRSLASAGSSSGASYHPTPYALSYGQEMEVYGNQAVVPHPQALVPRNSRGEQLVTANTLVEVMQMYDQHAEKRLAEKTGSLREELKGQLDSSLGEVKKDAAEAAAYTAKRFDDNEGALKESVKTLSTSIVSVAKEGKDNSIGIKKILDEHTGQLKANEDRFSVLGKRQADSETLLSQIRDFLNGNPGPARPPSPPPAPPAPPAAAGRGAGKKKK